MPTNKYGRNYRIWKLSFCNHCRKINSDKKHQWILKLVGESEIKTDIFTCFKVAPHKLSKHK